MNNNDLGRVAVGEQALVNDAPTGHHPSGFDPSREARPMKHVGTLNIPFSAMSAELEACNQIASSCHPEDPMCRYYRQRAMKLGAKMQRLKVEGRVHD